MHTYRVKAVTDEGSSVWGRKVTGKYIITGDLNFDSEVTLTDYNMLNQYLSNSMELNSEQIIAADVDNSGTVTTEDRTIINNYINNIITVLPAGIMRFAVYGDVDGNGIINTDDNDIINKFLIGDAKFTNIQKMCADVDLNGVVNSDDYALHRQYLLDVIPELLVR
jgi:hypothetical protein